VGWEIDVDEEALARYDAYIRAHSPLSHRLQTAIDREADPPCFILDEEERCPFLNSCGLCDLITTHGEESLCRICTDHPRFRRVMADRVELGLGLCCEAAAELILSRREPMTLIPLPMAEAASEPAAHADPEELDSVTTTLLEARGAVLKILQDRTRPLSDRIRHVLTALRIRFPMSTCAAWAEFLRDMERLDPAWDDCLDALAACGETDIEEIGPYLVPMSAVGGFVEGDIVELISGPFKGEHARVQNIDQGKEEITVELIDAMVPIPVTVKGDSVRVIEKEK
jgi:hypothetical protein